MPHKVLVQLSKPRSDGSRGRRLAIDTSASGDGTIGLTPLAGGGAEVVGASGFEPGPLGGTFERRVKRGKLQDCESPELLLGIREGAILYTPLSILQSHRGPGLRGLQWIATDVDVGLDERFVVRPPRTEVGIIFVRIPCRKSFW